MGTYKYPHNILRYLLITVDLKVVSTNLLSILMSSIILRGVFEMKSKEWQLLCYVKPESSELEMTYCRVEDTNAFLENINRMGVDLTKVVICRSNGIYFYTGDFADPVHKYHKSSVGWNRWTLMNAVFLPTEIDKSESVVIDFSSSSDGVDKLSDYNYPMIVQSRDDAVSSLSEMFNNYIRNKEYDKYVISLEVYTARGRYDFLMIPSQCAETYIPSERYLESHNNVHRRILSQEEGFIEVVQWIVDVVGGVDDSK